MTDPVLVLDFEMTMDEMGAKMKRAGWSMRREWLRRGIAVFILWLAVDYWRSGDFWTFGVFLLCAAFMVTPSAVIIWWVMRLLTRNQPPAHVRIEIDDTGLHMHDPKQKTHNCFWWSRLTGVEETDGDFELTFDGESYPQMYIPACAFDSQEQRETFLNLVEKHLPQRTDDRVA